MSTFVEESSEIICPICRVVPNEPTNFCLDHAHEKCCKECISSYVESTVSSAFMGSCPIVACPSASHQNHGNKRRRILLYEEWHKALPPATSKRYSELAGSLLAFLCGGCHALKSLDVGFDGVQGTGGSYLFMEKYLREQDGTLTITDLLHNITSFSSNELNVEEMYACLLKDFFPNLMTLTDPLAWEVFCHVLRLIIDPERRANLHLRYLRDRPRIKTLCCSREHCFRCKVKEFHEGKSCMESSTELDHSVVNCPTCGIALSKGDGCNTITCVCGKQFSWTAEKENTDRCVQFLQSYPENTSVRCANILCTEPSSAGTVVQQAQAWQIRNRLEVSRCLQQWFRDTYWPCPSQCCVTLPLESMPEGVRQAADIWKTHRPREVAKCEEQKKIARESLFQALYPDEAIQAQAAHELVNNNRRLKGKPNPRHDAQMLVASATAWIEAHREAYVEGVENFEIRQAKQFLYLFGSKKLHVTKPAFVNCPYAFEWCREISNDDLAYANQNTTVTRPGSVSCYPAAFAKLVGDHSMFRVSVDVAPRSSNWLTFGLARRGMATTSSDGVGRTVNTWGVADDRSSSSLPIVSACGTNVGHFRKLAVGDVLSAEVDVATGWFEIRLNDGEYTHRFDIPVGSMEDYLFAMTFANDHQVTIQYDDTAPGSVVAGSSKGGEMNLEHTRMYNSFRKQLKLLLTEPEDANSSAGADTGTSSLSAALSQLRTPASKWVDTCGSATSASNYYDAIRGELHALVKFGREHPWKEASSLPWLTWQDILDAASWFYDNRAALKESHDAGLAYTFSLTHGADAPFIAALNLADFHTHRVEKADVQASLAFMRFYPDEMNEWYDYDIHSPEPMIENVVKVCRCLPRHIKKCPLCK